MVSNEEAVSFVYDKLDICKHEGENISLHKVHCLLFLFAIGEVLTFLFLLSSSDIKRAGRVRCTERKYGQRNCPNCYNAFVEKQFLLITL